MKIEYPELEKEPAFKGLTTTEMKFVWYYGNRTSPYFTHANGEINKVKCCIKMSFKASAGGEPLPEKDYRRYLESNFPEKIKDAISAMGSYNPSARLRARFAIENAFSNLVTSLDITDKMKEEMDNDIDLRKKYIELSIKVTESLPLVTAQLEEGYGIIIFLWRGR